MLTKMVNGVAVEMSAEEESAIRAEWAKNEARAKESARIRELEEIKSALVGIDISSIRAIREYITSLPNAPQRLKDLEAEAVTLRGKLV